MGRFTEDDIILKNYRIEKSIGQGAFGEVYLATHLGLNGKRAVKVLLRDEIGMGSSDYDEYRNRFRQESQLMEWFKHPNVVTVYDFQEEDNVLFLVMEYAAGGNLQKKLETARRENTPFTIEEVVRVGIDIADGLSALHAKDVVHRDLKPSNILFGADGHAKVADLGLAQVPGGASMRSQLSVPKPHPGTPAYMSPEQELAGSYLRPSSDIYSLGLILFEMISGRSYKNLRPGSRLKGLVPSSPEWLDDLLAKMLVKEADNRPWDGSEAVQELRTGLDLGDQQMREAREKARLEADERARCDSEEKARREEEERTRLVEQEKERLAADLQAKREAEDKARIEKEERIRLVNLEKARLDLEERTRKSAEIKSLRERELKDLEEQVRTALHSQDMTQAEKALSSLKKMGIEGNALAKKLSSEYKTGNKNSIEKYWWEIVAGIAVLAGIVVLYSGSWEINPNPTAKIATSTPFENASQITSSLIAPSNVPVLNEKIKDPNTITFITGTGEPESLDPAWTYETVGSTIEQNIYEGLTFFKREKTDEFIPALATDWKTSEDGLTWTFNIRKGVKFHEDGTLEPHDVAYTAQRAFLQGRMDGWQWILYETFYGPEMAMGSIKDFASEYLKSANTNESPKFEDLKPNELVKVCENIKTKVVADDAAGTVTFKLRQPVPWMLALTSQQFLGGILDQEWMKENGDWDGDCATWTKFADPAAEKTILYNKANGTGPYKLDHWTPGSEIIMTANENYWRQEPMWDGGPSGVPSIKRIVIKNIDEWSNRLSILKSGDADEIYIPEQNRTELEPFTRLTCGIDESTCKENNADGYLKFFRNLPMPAITPAQFNWQINVEGGNQYVGTGKLDGKGIPANFFSDIHIRKAFSACFDYDAMIKNVLAGEGIQAQGPLPLDMMGYLKDAIPINKYDPAVCEAEFKAADVNQNGKTAATDKADVWEQGFYMQIAYNSGNDIRHKAAEILKANIEKVNPKFSIAILEMQWPAMLESRRQGKLPIYVGGWVEDYHDPHNWVNPFLYSQGAYSRIVNMTDEYKKKYDDLIILGTKASGNKARTPIYEKIQKESQEDAVNIWMYQVMGAYPFQSWINGFYFNPAYGNPEYGWVYSLSKGTP